MNVFAHSGDLGDVVACLPAVKALGGGEFVIFDRPNGHRESLKGARFDVPKPLLEAQPYVSSVRWSDEPVETPYDFSTFRHDHVLGEDLASWQARHLGIPITTDPWLTAIRSPHSIGRTVVARSTRYQNRDFPWKRLVSQYRQDILFVGTSDEHRAFQVSNGCVVEYYKTENLLELAELINGADRFIGNQSCPFWIAAGLGVPLIQEVCGQCPNSQIKRRNARYFLRPPFSL